MSQRVDFSQTTKEEKPRDTRWLVFVTVVGLALFATKTLVIDNIQSPFKRVRFADGLGVQRPLEANFANRFVLLGADLPESVPSGGTVQLNLYWRLYDEPVGEDYASIVHLRDGAGTIVAEGSSFQPGGLATSNWLAGYYVQERLDLAIPPGTPPGTYTLDAGLFRPRTQERLDLINASGNPEDVKVRLGTVTITRPDRPVRPDFAVNAGGNDEVALLLPDEADTLPDVATVGRELNVSWLWSARRTPSPDYRARLAWLAADEEVAATSRAVPLTTGYPTNEWQAGDYWTGHHRLYVPGGLRAGEYRVIVQLVGPEGDVVGETMPLQTMVVETPPRRFDVPGMQYESDVTWSNGITLLGYDLERWQFTLYWQPEDELTVSLRRFVHLVDSEGHIVAVRDGIPVEWTRPTTGWAAGEVIADPVTFTPPGGEYTVRVGWYDPADGIRVTLPDGETWWSLPVSP